MRTPTRVALAALLVAALLATTGCIVRRERVDDIEGVQTAEESVALGSAERAVVDVDMGAGDLSIEGASLDGDVMQGTFIYSPDELEPEVDGDAGADTIEVSISHPRVSGLNFGTRNFASDWDIALAEGIPTDLRVSLGAGNGDLDLTGLDVTDLRLDMGAGDVTLDLSGPRDTDLDARVTAGAGTVTVQLPADVGVRVSGRQDGVGEWVFDGFTTDGDYLVNEAYGQTDTTIELDVQRGVGRVELELVD
jgi:hypothetical protein